MRFLVDRCAGRRLAEWLREQGHDVLESRERDPDPGDHEILKWAASEHRILITIDTDFGRLVFLGEMPHCGLLRLPDVPASERIELTKSVVARHGSELEDGAIVTVRRGRIRISRRP